MVNLSCAEVTAAYCAKWASGCQQGLPAPLLQFAGANWAWARVHGLWKPWWLLIAAPISVHLIQNCNSAVQQNACQKAWDPGIYKVFIYQVYSNHDMHDAMYIYQVSWYQGQVNQDISRGFLQANQVLKFRHLWSRSSDFSGRFIFAVYCGSANLFQVFPYSFMVKEYGSP